MGESLLVTRKVKLLRGIGLPSVRKHKIVVVYQSSLLQPIISNEGEIENDKQISISFLGRKIFDCQGNDMELAAPPPDVACSGAATVARDGLR